MDGVEAGLIEWGVAGRPCAGQTESGDQFCVEAGAPGGKRALVAVVDALGHGQEAAAAARIAIATLGKGGAESPIGLMGNCHQALHGTRGVVMSLAAFRAADHTMTWLGVGNVEGILLRRDRQGKPGQEVLLARPGVVGGQLPGLAASTIPVARGDLLIFATDGIREGFADGANPRHPPQQTADWILEEFGRETDDALVVVARYTGGGQSVAGVPPPPRRPARHAS